MRVLAATLALALTASALAQEPAGPPMPRPRPGPAAVAPAADTTPGVPAVPLPRPRPAPPPPPGAEAPPPRLTPPTPTVPGREPAPPRVYQTACPAVLAGSVEARMLPPMAEGACMVRSPLEVASVLVNGRPVELRGNVVTGCAVATVLPQWAGAIDGYLAARTKASLVSIIVGTSYACRPRNNVDGADVSEHGFANALDVVGFTLSDGRTVTVEGGWPDALSEAGRLLRFAHDAACALFTTTLGPEADALHADHVHVDLGCHGRTCTARLCE